MSIQALNWALEQSGSPTQKHVLLVLANYANENGVAFPSTRLLAAKTGLTDRSIRNAKKALITAGLLEKTGGYGRCSVRLCLNHHTADKAEAPSTLPESHDHQQERPSALYNHHRTTINPQTPPQPPLVSTSQQTNSLPDWLPAEPWHGWLEMRRSIKKPVTPRAITLAIKRLAALKAQGHDPSAVLDSSTFHGWHGLFPLKKQRTAPSAPAHMSESERNRTAIFEEMRTHYDTQSHSHSHSHSHSTGMILQ